MERNDVDIRLAADIVERRHYPDIYEWIRFQCSIWTWAGGPLPSADDPRFARFAEPNTTPSGEIETTHHVVWVGCVKMKGASYYSEFKHFGQ